MSTSTKYSSTCVPSSARGCNKNYKTRTIEHPASIKQPKAQALKCLQTRHSQPMESVHRALQAANPTFDGNGLPCHSTRRESWNVSLQRKRRSVRSASRVPNVKPTQNTMSLLFFWVSSDIRVATLRGAMPCLFRSLRDAYWASATRKHSTSSEGCRGDRDTDTSTARTVLLLSNSYYHLLANTGRQSQEPGTKHKHNCGRVLEI